MDVGDLPFDELAHEHVETARMPERAALLALLLLEKLSGVV